MRAVRASTTECPGPGPGPGHTTGKSGVSPVISPLTLSHSPVLPPDRLVSPSQPLLNIRKTPNIITRRLAQFRDHSITTRETNHLMLALTSSEMRVGQAWLGSKIKLNYFYQATGLSPLWPVWARAQHLSSPRRKPILKYRNYDRNCRRNTRNVKDSNPSSRPM